VFPKQNSNRDRRSVSRAFYFLSLSPGLLLIPKRFPHGEWCSVSRSHGLSIPSYLSEYSLNELSQEIVAKHAAKFHEVLRKRKTCIQNLGPRCAKGSFTILLLRDSKRGHCRRISSLWECGTWSECSFTVYYDKYEMKGSGIGHLSS
jgi:hypothetical protein